MKLMANVGVQKLELVCSIICLLSQITLLRFLYFSDTYGSQNRNQNIAALLLYIVQSTHLQVMEHKFLESGHSYMEVDSMHSAIENAKKFVPLYSMQDWPAIFRIAQSKRLRNMESDPTN